MKKFLAIVAVTAFLASAGSSVWAGEGCEHGCKDKDKAAAKEKDKGTQTPTAGTEKKEDGQKS